MVLVVEDEFLISMDLETFLISHNHTVLGPAATVEAALRYLEEPSRPDVALLDFNLRGKNVLPVAERLNQLDIPVIMMSAYGQAELSRFVALASVRYVRKPYCAGELLRTLDEVTSSGPCLS